jgi:hypothetical protein
MGEYLVEVYTLETLVGRKRFSGPKRFGLVSANSKLMAERVARDKFPLRSNQGIKVWRVSRGVWRFRGSTVPAPGGVGLL